MILTGKAKDKFLTWYGNRIGITLTTLELIYQSESVIQNALIVEWFDTIGTYITIEGVFDGMLGYHRGYQVHIYQDSEHPISMFKNHDVFESRQEATEAAITKANEIYNERYGK